MRTRRRYTTRTFTGYHQPAPMDSAWYATEPAEMVEDVHTFASTPVTTLNEHRVPCATCLWIAHKGMMQAIRYPDNNNYRERWEAWAAETFLYSYSHSARWCKNTIRIG